MTCSGQLNLATVLEFSQYSRSDSLGVRPPFILMWSELAVVARDVSSYMFSRFAKTPITRHWYPFCL